MTVFKRLAGGLFALLIPFGAGAQGQGDPAKGERIFARCQACHSLEAGQNKVGPTLAGVFGREAGSVEDYNYSSAMQEADLVWNEETLDPYLADPREYIPGTKMVFAGIPDEQDRQDLIAYLREATQQ